MSPTLLGLMCLVVGPAAAQDAAWRAAFDAGVRAFHAGRLTEAELQFVQSIELIENYDAPERFHPSSALGTLFLTTGRFVQAEPYLRDALEIRERVLGPDASQTGVGLWLGSVIDGVLPPASWVSLLARHAGFAIGGDQARARVGE